MILPALVDGFREPQDPWIRPTLAAALLRHGRPLEEALAVVDDDQFPVSAFAHMVRLAPVGLRPELIEEGKHRARQDFRARRYFPEYAGPIEDLLTAATDLPAELHDDLLREYLDDLEQERLRIPSRAEYTRVDKYSTPLTSASAFLGPHLAGRAGPLPYEIWRRALHEASEYGRRCLTSTLANLAPLAAGLAAPGSAAALTTAVTDVRRWWP